MPEILGEELDRGYPDSAAAVLDVVANVEFLAGASEVRREVIRAAAEDPDLRRELVRLDAAPVLALGRLLGPSERHLLLGPFIVRYHDLDVGEEEREGLAEVLADHLPEMAEEQRRGLQGLIGGRIREQFGVYLPLVRADRALLAPQAIDTAIAELGKSRSGSPDPASPAPFAESAPGALSIVKLAVRRSLDPAHAERVAGVCAALLGVLGPSFGAFQGELRDILELLEPLELPGSPRWNEMANSLEVRWGELFTEDAAALLGLAGVVLPRCIEGRGAEVASFIASRIFEDPSHALALLEKLGEPAKIFRDPLVENLRPLVGTDQHWEAAAEAIMRLGIEAPHAPLINGFCELYRLGAYPQARDLFDRYASLLEPHTDELAAAAVGLLAERAEAGEPGPGDLIGRLAAMMDAGQLDQLATRLADVLTGPFAEEARVAIEEAATLDQGRLRTQTAHYALGRIDDTQPPPSASLVSLISAAAGDLSSDDQEHFAEQVAFRLGNFPGQVPELLPSLRLAGGLPADPAKTIADPLLERERSESVDVSFRIELLRTAAALRVRRGTRVSHKLEARLAELERSEAEEDRAVAVELRDLLNG